MRSQLRRNADGRFPCLPVIRPVHPEPLSPYLLRISSAGPIIPGGVPRFNLVALLIYAPKCSLQMGERLPNMTAITS
jgi:hypothetical protein